MIGEVIKTATEISKELPDVKGKLSDLFNPDKRIDIGRKGLIDSKSPVEKIPVIGEDIIEDPSIYPNKKLDIGRESHDASSSSEKYSPDKRLERKLDRDKIYTTNAERTKMAAHSRGEWLGKVGNSEFRPSSELVRKALESFNQTGIKYKDGNPDFSKCSVETVRIKEMSSNREKNFAKADKKAAEKWNAEGKFDKTDWTRNDVRNWRHENRYSWHERIDKKTMDLVQRDIHDECKHFGGVSECKRMERAVGEFDA